jgi:hypothetical protein
MRLAQLLADASIDDLERLAQEHAKTEDQLPRPQLLSTIESVLRSYRFLQEFLLNRQPPTFALMTLLLDAPGFELPTEGFRDAVIAETTRISDAIDNSELLKRDDQLRVYRRVLYQARSNDLQIDSSEASILSVLRQELEVALVEHCLIEHHADLREFWRQEGAFLRELHALRSAGLVFVKEGKTLVPEDLVPSIRQVLGIDMSRPAARRLYQLLTAGDLQAGLKAIGAGTAGSKDERVERLISHMAQPRVVLRELSLETLKGISRSIETAVAGSKDDLVARIISHMAADRDLETAPEPDVHKPEIRVLSEERFTVLFSFLRGHELAGILGDFDLRRWGTKDLQVKTLWEAELAEATLLECLSNPELDVVLRRLDLRPGGAKAERINRLIEHFTSLDEVAFRAVRITTPPLAADEFRG